VPRCGERRVARGFIAQIDALQARGAQGVILGCTEIMLLLDPTHHALPMFDSTSLHAAAAVDCMLAEPPTPSPSPSPEAP
jgi:aspartate racemase